MNKLWKRYFFFELTKVFLLIIFSVYFVYMLIDYSTHTKDFQQHGAGFFGVFVYYLFQLSKQLELLLPTAVLLASVKVVLKSAARNELISLLCSGISAKRLCAPFFLFGFACMTLGYLNHEYIQPRVYTELAQFDKKEQRNQKLNPLLLPDQTLLVYKSFNPHTNQLEDLFWYKGPDEVYKVDLLDVTDNPPIGYGIHHFVRNEQSQLVLRAELEAEPLDQIQFEQNKSLFYPPKWQPISQLFHNVSHANFAKMSSHQATTSTFFYYKLCISFSCILAALAPLCFCLNYSRHFSAFLVYAGALGGLIFYFTLLNCSVILSENQIIAPYISILSVVGLFAFAIGYKYARL